MAIPKEVMAHMNDNPHVDSAPVCLQHLLDLWAHAVTAYALERHPDTARVGEAWSPSTQESYEINAMLVEVNIEFNKHHKHAWLKEVTYTVDTSGSGSVYIPDEHQYIMDYLIAIRNANPSLIHSAVPERAPTNH